MPQQWTEIKICYTEDWTLNSVDLKEIYRHWHWSNYLHSKQICKHPVLRLSSSSCFWPARLFLPSRVNQINKYLVPNFFKLSATLVLVYEHLKRLGQGKLSPLEDTAKALTIKISDKYCVLWLCKCLASLLPLCAHICFVML